MMRRVFLASAAVIVLHGPVCAQNWIPPRPGPNGIDVCSGWNTAAAQQKCADEEFAKQKETEDEKRAADARWRAIKEAADAKVRAERAESARLAAERADEDRKRAALDAEAEERRKDEAQRDQDRRDTEAVLAAERAREAEEARAMAAKEAQSHREKLVAKMRVDAEAKAQEAARAEAADPFKRVDALDLNVSPADFVGRSIKLSGLQCYAPSPSGRRCVEGETLILLQPDSVEPAEVQRLLDHACSSFRVAMTDAACRWTARFVLDDFHVDRTDDGERRVVLLSREAELSQQ